MSKKVYLISDEDKTGINLALEIKGDDEVTICLLQDAVFFANKKTPEIAEALNRKFKVVACKEDVECRGINNFIFDEILLQDYSQLVDVFFEADKIINA